MSKVDHTVWMRSAIGQDLSESEAREIHYISKREEYAVGEHLFDEDSPAVEIFLIVSGRVDVVKAGVAGRTMVLSELGGGAILGEMSLLTQGNRSSTAIAREKTMVFRVEWEQFQVLLRNEPQVAFKVVNGLARLMASRLKRINSKMAELLTMDAGEAASQLEDFAEFKKRLMSEW